MERLREVVGRATGSAVTATSIVRGGDTAQAFRYDLDDGRAVFAKTHPDPPPGFFTTEAEGLRWLRAPGVVPVPAVLSVSDGEPGVPPHLVLEWIAVGHGASATEPELGRALAELHRAGAPCFGREDRRTTGSRALPNEPCASWADFYGTQRLLPLARLARDAGALPGPTIERLERLADPVRLGQHGAADEPPARLHGDLWAGNRLVDTAGRSWLIDPAAHGGHREFDLAMMQLFGGFSSACFAAYDDAFPLADDWPARVRLHQVAPLVVHALKFGGGYVSAASSAIEAYA